MSRKKTGVWRLWLALSSILILIFVSACGGGDGGGAATEAPDAGGEPTEAVAGGEPTEGAGAGAEPTATTPKIEATPKIRIKPTGVASVKCQEGQRELVWMVRNSPVENDWETRIVRPAFAKAQSEICLQILSINQDDIAVKRATMLSSGQALHVWSPNWGGNGFASDRAEDLLEDLTPLIEQDKFDTSVFIPSVLKIYEVEGKVYGLPFLTTGSYVYYNQKLLKEAGIETPPTNWDDKSWTWNKMISMAKKLTKNTNNINKAQYGLQTAWLNLEGPPMMFGHFIWPEDAYDTGYAKSVNVTNDKSIMAFQALHDAVYKDKVAPNPSVTTALDQLGGAFASGRVAMAMSGGWGHWSWKELITDPNGFCWGVAPMPWGTPDAKTRTVIYTDPWVITSGLEEEQKQDAWTFVKFLVSEEQARSYTETTGTPPTQTKLLAEYYKQFSKCMPEAKMKEVFEGAFTHGRESSNHLLAQWDELNQVWVNNLDPFFTNKNAKASEALPKIEKGTNAALDQINAERE